MFGLRTMFFIYLWISRLLTQVGFERNCVTRLFLVKKGGHDQSISKSTSLLLYQFIDNTNHIPSPLLN